jgi:hypothetical protein
MLKLKSCVAALCLTALSFTSVAHADSVTKLNGFQANSVQTFSPEALASFALLGVSVQPLGNTTELLGTFTMPITETIYGASKYVGLGAAPYAGGSIGSALSIERKVLTATSNPRLTLANFRINYHTRQVLADATIAGQATTSQMPIYTFNVARPMAQEINEAGMLSLDEKLDNLKMTPEAVKLFMAGLKLPTFARPVMQMLDYGSLVQTVILLPRPSPVLDAPYVAN